MTLTEGVSLIIHSLLLLNVDMVSSIIVAIERSFFLLLHSSCKRDTISSYSSSSPDNVDAVSEPNRADFFVFFWRLGGGGLSAVVPELGGGCLKNLNLFRSFSFHEP